MLTSVLDRTKPPALKEVKQLNISRPGKVKLNNGIPLHLIHSGQKEVCRIDFIFDAGRKYQPGKLVAKLTGKMLKEGTKSYDSNTLAQQIDFYGATLKTHIDGDCAYVTVYSLTKYLPDVLPLVEEVIKSPVFPERELGVILHNAKNRLKVNLAKDEYVADRAFSQSLYGQDHPYSNIYLEEDYEKIKRDQLISFHQAQYHSGNCKIIASGKIDEGIVQHLEKHFGMEWDGPDINIHSLSPHPDAILKHRINPQNQFQSSIRIGRLLFNKTHPDFQKLYVLNTIFGGYFGSRLMTNIREEKGYTYGIHSGLSSMVDNGYFYISTEVGAKVCDNAVEEIYKEMQRLKEELIPEDEMQLVRNYLAGKIVSGLDGPFKLANMLKNLIICDMDLSYVDKLLNTVKTVSTEELRELANNYFDLTEMYEIVVGQR